MSISSSGQRLSGIGVIILVSMTLLPEIFRIAGQAVGYTVQVASVSSAADAWAAVDRMQAAGLAGYVIRVIIPGVGTRYRIRYGSFRTAAEARTAGEKALGSGKIPAFVVMREEGVREERPGGWQQGGSGKPLAGKPLARTTPTAAVRPIEPLQVEISGPGWEVLSSGALPAVKWQAMRFIDQMTGWIAGDGGALYRTTDGGRSWWKSRIETSSRLIDLWFIDWNRGWVLGEAEVGAGGSQGRQSALLFSTIDGGRTWRRGELDGGRRVFFATESDGWITGTGSLLMRTRNRGLTWTPVSGPAIPQESQERWRFEDIFFTGQGQGWMIGNSDDGRDQGPALWKTTDDGASWQRQVLPRTVGGPGARLERLRFFSPAEGLVTGSSDDGSQRRAFRLTTLDGGLNWSLTRMPGTSFIFPEIRGGLDSGWTLIPGDRPEQRRLASLIEDGTGWRDELNIRGSAGLRLFMLSPTRGWLVSDSGIVLGR